ncbi:MAG: hypothetical protein EBR82_17165 [Caulobacteraceae bacterium]|nr:hypothetical protein [Caulobacteraceae bacterium]
MNLIEKVRFWARHNSVRLAAVAGPAMAFLVEHRHDIEPVLASMTPLERMGATFVLFTVLPTWLRTKPQAALSKPDGQ